jgi:histidinol-phosphate aminotransferase
VEIRFSTILGLIHTDARASFVFFDAGHQQAEIATSLQNRGVEIGRAFPTLSNRVRITVGLPEENNAAQEKLRTALSKT